ncbi:hypothetical protein G3485_23155 [Shewanella baltica]|uniref:hypothetical protein n=1 Tax=Shewanella baltica TaxID=62322 RepID=UPI00217CE50E|nr:hypothetical protein [Shewanella baltica]MCS6129981.1 hypothetical protein [Shewanella baltica]MCS6141892.1 hypothetical protein [Shewanella baltica]MCS6148227.1 hypothetical protein [Shewanella baltica]MCS6172781.1 hypothetical protein [Shewanella baltica]MCS6189979.1 hypothetical protein [Shewanella baltica]
MTISIKYIHSADSRELGSETFSGFNEVLIPDFNDQKHDVYLRKIFTSEPNVELWKIEDYKESGTDVEFYVLPQKHSTSLGVSALSQNQKISHYIDANKYQLVEVEFGIQQDIMTLQGRTGKNTLNSSALFPGELYKKRPCILLSSSGDRAKIIPLTSDGSRSDPKQMYVDPQAFKGLQSRYTLKQDGSPRDCYALVDIIQTVSTFRIHPMRLSGGNFSLGYNRNCLTSNDIKDLRTKLAKIHADDILTENVKLNLRLESQNKERKKLVGKKSELTEELNMAKTYINTLEQSLKDLALFEGLNCDTIDILITQISQLRSA